jgi:small GTP-binding protein
MSFSVGIVGLPNVGKSTLFKALTKKQALIANYPFATIDPNVGIVEVPDERLAQLAAVSVSEKVIPTTIEFVDIAGLVKGASTGEGLGNKFLAHIREVDAIAQVVRVFSDPNVIHVHSKPDPKSDIEVIGVELALADLKTVEKRLHDVNEKTRGGDFARGGSGSVGKEAAKSRVVLEKLQDGLNQGKWARGVLSEDEQHAVRDLHLLTMKPVLYVYNVDEKMTGVASESPGSAEDPRYNRDSRQSERSLSAPERSLSAATLNIQLIQTPVEQLSKHLSPHSVDVIVTEPYLGPTRQTSSVRDQVKGGVRPSISKLQNTFFRKLRSSHHNGFDCSHNISNCPFIICANSRLSIKYPKFSRAEEINLTVFS